MKYTPDTLRREAELAVDHETTGLGLGQPESAITWVLEVQPGGPAKLIVTWTAATKEGGSRDHRAEVVL